MAEEELETKWQRFYRYFDIDLLSISEAAFGGEGGDPLSNYYTKSQTDVVTNALDARITDLEDGSDFVNYYTKTETNVFLNAKADVNHNHDGRYYTSTIIDNMLLDYASENALVSLTGRVEVLEEGVDFSNYYTKAQSEALLITYTTTATLTSLLAGKSDTTHNHDTRYYTKTQVDTTLGGYTTTSVTNALDARVADLEMGGDLSNYYTKSQSDSLFATITSLADLDDRVVVLEGSSGPDLTNYYTKTQADTLLDAKATVSALTTHTSNTSNPHSVTKTQVGLANVDNTSDTTKNAAAVALTNKDLTSGTNTFPTFNQSTSGNAATATALATPRNINGVAFDGTTNITVADSTKVPTTRTVNGHALSADVTVTATDVGLGNASNTSDANKPVSTATQTALDLKADLVGGLIPSSQLPAIAISTPQTAASQAAQLALTTQEGDVVIRTDEHKTYMRNAGTSGTMTDFTYLDTPADAVTSVNGNIGTVVLAKGDIGLGNVDNTSDSTKNAATVALTNKDLTSGTNTFPTFNQSTSGNAATATKLLTARNINGVAFDGTGNITVADATKVPTTTTVNGHALSGNVTVTASDLSLGNVDNTSDATKNAATVTLTNKTISGASNTLTNIAQSSVTNLVTDLSNKQPLDSDLTTIAGLTATTDSILQSKGSAWTTRTPAQFKTDLALVKADVGLGNVDNTADTAKPISSLTQTALDGKQPLDSDLTTIAALTVVNDSIMQGKAGAWAVRTPAQFKTDLVLVKADVGLGSVDNTADTAKPVSTAQQTALNLKADATRVAALEADTIVALTDAATVATDASLGRTFGVTLGGNRTLGVPTNPTDGMNRTWRFRQDATGTRTITLTTGTGGFVLGSQIANTTLTATANKVGYMTARYDSSYPGGARWCVLAFEPGV